MIENNTHTIQNGVKHDSNNKIEAFGKVHEWKRVALILSTIVMFVITCGFNALSSLAFSPNAKLFPAPTGNISDKFYIEITPAGWVFSIWGFIYTWQAIWLVYSFTCLFRRTNSGYYLYIHPDFLHYGIFITYIINLISNLIWIFLWAYEHLGWALLFLVAITATNYIVLFISHRKLSQNEQHLRDERATKEIWMVRFFIQNGIAFYATWVSIAANLNFAIYISWRLGADIQNASTAALFLVLGAIINYFILENFVWRRYLHYTFSPWIVIFVALVGSLTKNWQASSPTRNNIITLIMLIIVIFLIIARIILFILYKTVLKHRFLNFRVSDQSKEHQNGHANINLEKLNHA